MYILLIEKLDVIMIIYFFASTDDNSSKSNNQYNSIKFTTFYKYSTL